VSPPATDGPHDGAAAEHDAAEGAPPPPGHVDHGSEAEIDEVGEESFPASDAPPWWSGDRDDPDQ